ncbi:MAG: tRNA pseudouridine(13) synthase TruD [Chloroflexi bacterium]|nr:MAG: tRNA pseudouridine(13) synthase TruD [Chloroflexota bacterium]
MRIKAQPEDFIVEEQIRLPLAHDGKFLLYRVSKRGLNTLDVQEQIAAALHIGKERIAFPALKDKEALATQYASVLAPQVAAPLRLNNSHASGEARFEAERVGAAARALQPSDLTGNLFTIVVRDLALDQAQAIRPRLQQIGEFGMPNYFDEQRFGSFAGDAGFVGKKILQRDAESALRIYLATKMAGDPERVRVFKEFAHEQWGNWPALMERAPKPSNFRSVLTYLKDHPQDYRRALNLIPHRLLALYLSAYQSWLWNLIAARYITSALSPLGFTSRSIRVAGNDLPVYLNLPESVRLRFARTRIPLPNHRAVFSEPELAQAASELLAQEGLTLNDFKARILKKAFAAKSSRALIVEPSQIEVGDAENDELARKRWKVTMRYFLPPGSYATLVVKSIMS